MQCPISGYSRYLCDFKANRVRRLGTLIVSRDVQSIRPLHQTTNLLPATRTTTTILPAAETVGENRAASVKKKPGRRYLIRRSPFARVG